MDVECRVLDKVAVAVDGVPVKLDPGQGLAVGVLVLVGGLVPKKKIATLLWGTDMLPANPPAAIHTIVGKTRAAMSNAVPGAGELLKTVHGVGYELEFAHENIDYYRFRDRMHQMQAVDATEHAEIARLGRRALAEWGPGATGIHGGHPLGAGAPASLESYQNTIQMEYRATLIACLRAELECGRHQELVPEMQALFGRDDTGASDEELCRLLMLAYCRVGQTPAALDVYRRLTGALGLLGAQPDEKTNRLYERIRKRDPRLQVAKGAAVKLDRTTRPNSDAAEPDESSDDAETVQSETAGEQPDASTPEKAPRQSGQRFGDTHITGGSARVFQIGESLNYYEGREGK